MKLHSRTVVVTGAARGIGRALALRSAEEGARVAAFDVNPDVVAALAAELGSPHLALTCDVTDEVQVSERLQSWR
jgi:NAD(P)-dependent dehydrogenase (short-subunit alcohol dehydrogenase family)